MGNFLKEVPFLDISDKEIEQLHRKIALNVKNLRVKKGISQLDLALSIGHKSMSTIGKIEAGLENKHYNIEQLYKISKALEVPLIDLIN
jgi:transcriptional regulator with XRE-family HTH domain